MKLLKTIVALVLLVIWIPAASLCLAERAGWLSNDDCCPSSSQNENPPSGDTTCCALASATYKADDNRPIAPVAPSAVLPAFFTLTESVVALDGPQSASLSPSPPELLTTWQFSYRAAAPPRAPSFVS